jgi:formate hydrogenlyase subunit 4
MDPTAQIVNVLQAATVLLLSPLLAGIAGKVKGLF